MTKPLEVHGNRYVDEIAKCQDKHPSMSEIKSLPGYQETETGWTAPANGAWGEAMQPFWRADNERHQNNLGDAAYDPPKHSGALGWTRLLDANWPKGKSTT